jgi:glucose/arabinose dehydrogenase
MAFDPDFGTNGRFYLNFTVEPDGATRVVRYTVSGSDPDRADDASGDTLLSVDQPFANHNGGMLAFGPDGMLYVALGDGGSGGDPRENGQDSTTVLGSLARLDPDGGPPFVPDDNPFVGRDGDDRIWAYGLRNPWRFSFDETTGTLYIADVGQSDREEVNAVDAAEGGLNFGWDVMEGTICHEPDEGCDQSGLTLPVLDYGRDDGCSVTGGFVYRGAEIPDAVGRYFFSDFCSGFLRSFRLEGGEATDVVTHDVEDPGSVTSFGTGGDGELYLVTGGGRLLQVVAE